MAISRKPKPATSEGSAVDIDALIHKGGSVAGEGASEGNRQKLTPVMLRLPPSMLAKVDASVATRVVPTARTTWIMEAIVEKLEREQRE